MTTKRSPYRVLKHQADTIASTLKKAERGEEVDALFAEKIATARTMKAAFKVGIVMDDKTIIVELPWATIAESDEAALSAFIIGLMREERAKH